MKTAKSLVIMLAAMSVMALSMASANALTIESPLEQTYNGTVPVFIGTNETAGNLSYIITPQNGNGSNDSCENCTNLTGEFSGEEGNYTINAIYSFEETMQQASINFTILFPQSGNETENETGNETGEENETLPTYQFNFWINQPQNTTYNTSTVLVRLETNETVDRINFTVYDNNSEVVSGAQASCLNCSELNRTLNLTNGSYSLMANAFWGNQTRNDEVNFTVLIPANPPVNDTNQTNQTNQTQPPGNNTGNQTNQTGEPRFTVGLNKLPQAVENGEYTDSELAQIIRNNTLNPGVINRLIKSGMLGNESIDAIIETQSTPPGIFRKLAGFFGIHVPTPKERLMEEYELTEEQLESLVEAPDVTPKGIEKAQEKAENRGFTPLGLAKKAQNQGTQSDEEEEETSNNEKVPPGLAKKQESNAEAAKDEEKVNGNGRANAPGKNK